MVLRIDLCRLSIAMCHSPLWIDTLLIEEVSGQRSDFVKGWYFIHRQFVTYTKFISHRGKRPAQIIRCNLGRV